jgi:hypothetical protein
MFRCLIELKTHTQDLHERARLEGFALRLELTNADLAGPALPTRI